MTILPLPVLVLHEEDLSTKGSASQASSWLPESNANSRRSRHDQESSAEGAQAPRCIASRTATNVCRPASVDVLVGRRRMTHRNQSELTTQDTGLETLRNSRNFRRVLRDGVRCRQGGIVMVGSPGSPGRPRLGLIVSKQCGNAVTRNRIKRRLRHAVDGLRLQPGTDYVIIASGQVADAPFHRLQDWLRHALEEVSGV